jgi:hypothetical protein
VSVSSKKRLIPTGFGTDGHYVVTKRKRCGRLSKVASAISRSLGDSGGPELLRQFDSSVESEGAVVIEQEGHASMVGPAADQVSGIWPTARGGTFDECASGIVAGVAQEHLVAGRRTSSRRR